MPGEHPRLGAMDVCPFIPVKNVTMEDCVECAKEFGERLAMELGVPGNEEPKINISYYIYQPHSHIFGTRLCPNFHTVSHTCDIP